MATGIVPSRWVTQGELNAQFHRSPSPQLHVLRLGLLQDRDVGVGVFPQGEKVLVGSFRLGSVALQGVGATKAKMCQRTDGFVHHDSTMVEDFLKLGGGFATLMHGQIGLTAYEDRIQGERETSYAR